MSVASDDGWALRLFIAAEGLRQARSLPDLRLAICDAVTNMCGSERFGVWFTAAGLAWIDCDPNPNAPPRTNWVEDAWQKKLGLDSFTVNGEGAIVPMRFGHDLVGALVVREWLPQVKDSPERLLEALAFIGGEIEAAILRLVVSHAADSQKQALQQDLQRLLGV